MFLTKLPPPFPAQQQLINHTNTRNSLFGEPINTPNSKQNYYRVKSATLFHISLEKAGNRGGRDAFPEAGNCPRQCCLPSCPLWLVLEPQKGPQRSVSRDDRVNETPLI